MDTGRQYPGNGGFSIAQCIDQLFSCQYAIRVADELVIATDKGTYKIISEYNIRAVLCDGVTRVVRQDGSEVSMPSLLPSAFFVIEPSHDKKNMIGYNIIGGGFGHGVGMSQNGAKNMALQGLGAEQILNFFYEGCEICSGQ